MSSPNKKPVEQATVLSPANDPSSEVEKHERLATDDEIAELASSKKDSGLSRKIVIARGDNAEAWKWTNTAYTLEAWLDKRVKGCSGEKNGLAYLQGAIEKDGRRQNIVVAECFTFDVDNGQPRQEIIDSIKAKGIVAVVHPTASDGATETRIASDKIHKHFGLGHDDEATAEQVLDYARQDKAWRAEVSDSFQYGGYSEQQYIVKHIAYDRTRIVVPFNECVKLSDLSRTAAGSKEVFQNTYRATVKWIGIEHHDPSGEDLNRLMFEFRGPGFDGMTGFIDKSARLVTFDELRQLPVPPRPEKKKQQTKTKPSNGTGKQQQDAGSPLYKEVKRLWSRSDIRKNLNVAALAETYSDVGGGLSQDDQGEKYTGPCPFGHLDASGMEFIARNAKDSPKTDFTAVMSCRHPDCDGLKAPDFITQILQNEVTDASVLREYVEQEGLAAFDAVMSALPFGYELRNGVICEITPPDPNDEDSEEIVLKVCGQLTIEGLAQDENSEGWSKVFTFEDGNGVFKRIIVGDGELHGDTSQLCAKFADAGLKVEVGVKAKNAFVRLLHRAHSERQYCHVSQPGWQSNGVFVPPCGVAIKPDGVAADVNYLWKNAPPKFVTTPGGTLEAWTEAATKAVSMESPQLGIGVLLGAIGPFIQCAGLDPYGLFWAGATSSGKSSGAICQVSVWTHTDVDKGNRVNARATANGLEYIFARFNGTTGAIDDLQNGGQALAQDAVYMGANGSGKARMTKDAIGRPSYTWGGMSFGLTAELTPAQLVAEGRKATEVAGAYARVPLLGMASAPKFPTKAGYDAVMDGIKANYGHAGPAVVRAVQREGWHQDGTEVRKRIGEALDNVADGLMPAQKRAATVFALMVVAGEFMQQEGILEKDADVIGVVNWAWDSFSDSAEFKKLAPSEHASSALLEWAVTSGDVYEIGADIPPGREVLAWKDNKGTLFLPVSSLTKIKGLGTTPDAAIEALKSEGRVVKSGDKWTVARVPGGVRVSHYRITGVFDVTDAAQAKVERKKADSNKFDQACEKMADKMRDNCGVSPH